jgi:hypothetical protein
MLSYKCAHAGVWFNEVDEAFSTQTCSVCKSRAGPTGRGVLESEDGGVVFAERSMIVTSMQPTISSRRDIAVLRKEFSSFEGEEDVNSRVSFRESMPQGADRDNR